MSKRHVLFITVLAALLILISFSVAWAAGPKGLEGMPEPIDPQSWIFPRDMTWDMWHDNTAFNWKADGNKIAPTTIRKGLLVLCDFADRPFIVSSPKGSEQMSNPQIDGVPKEDLVEFWESFLNDPEDHYNDGLNHGITIQEFWRENTQGRWKVELDAVGVYTIPGFEFEYGLSGNDLPAGFTNRSGANSLAINAAIADGVDMSPYDFAFILHSGCAESQIWEEAGYMMFFDETTIDYEYSAHYRVDQLKKAGLTWAGMAATDTWLAAHPLPAKGEPGRGWWANTNYVPWTSWWAHTAIWSSTSSINLPGKGSFRLSQQGETNGCATFSHEFGHIVTIADNYGSDVNTRSYSGFWDLMCAGSMTGFGGNHTRYQVPNLNGGAIPAPMLARTKRKLGFVDTNQFFSVNYAALRTGTPAVTEIYSRTTPVGDQFGAIYPELAVINDKVKAGRAGLALRLYNFTDQKPQIRSSVDWESDTNAGGNRYDNYTMEVIDQVGYDSPQSDHGVLICKNRETLSESAPYSWVVDAHAGGLDTIDFWTPVGPNGEPSIPQPFRNNDNNHLSAALFHAGKSVTPNNYGVETIRTGQTNATYSIALDAGGKPIPKSIADNTVNEYVDTYNRLHFYILDKIYSPGPYDGDILSYQVAVRHFDGQAVGGELVVTKGKFEPADPGRVAVQWFSVKNTGAATDIVRIAVDCGLEFTLLNDLYAVDPDQTVEIPVYIKIPATDPEFKTLTFTAASETNAAKLGSVIISGFSAAIYAPAQIFIKEGNRIDYVVSIANVADEGANLFTIEAAFDAKNLNYTGYSFGPSLLAYSPSQGDFSYDVGNGKLSLGMYLARAGVLLKAETETPLVTFHFTLKDGVPAGPGTTVVESFLSKVTGYCFIDGKSSPIDAIVVKPGAPVKVLIHPLGYEGGDLDEATI
ncbi:MAG: hypothetical protein FWF85_10440, partial [Clostridiales bacterium]|nr:hypothetical protein [Clostridiales bacterium]